MSQKEDVLLPILRGQPVIPVLLINDVGSAIPLARALSAGGLPALEITLRTAAPIEAIRAVAAEVPEAIIGAGSVLDAKQYEDAVKAGSRFIVSPGATRQILDAAKHSPVPPFAGCSHAKRNSQTPRRWLFAFKVFSRRAGRRCGVSQLSLLSPRRHLFLSDGWHPSGKFEELSFVAKCPVCWGGVMGSTRSTCGSRGLERHRPSGKGRSQSGDLNGRRSSRINCSVQPTAQ